MTRHAATGHATTGHAIPATCPPAVAARRRAARRRSQRGAGLLDMLLSMVVLGTLTVTIGRWAQDYAVQMKDDAAAASLKAVATGLENYVKANISSIDTTLTARGNQPFSLALNDLTAQGWVSAGALPTNPHGHAVQLVIGRHASSRAIEAFVVTAPTGSDVSRERLPEVRARRIATRIGARGGFVMAEGGTLFYQGAYGAWRAPAAPYVGIGANGWTGFPVVAATYGMPGNLAP